MNNNSIDPKELEIPNINFSTTDKSDKREKKFRDQRIKRGFDDSETWTLFMTISNFVLPRLKRFRKITKSFPGDLSESEWNDVLDKMINSFELISKDDLHIFDKRYPEIKEGLDLFRIYFLDLWW